MASAGRAGPVARAPAPDRAPRAARGAARTLVYVPRYRLLANAHAAELSRVAPVPPARLPLPRVPTGGRSRPSVPVRALRPPPPSVSRRPAAPWQQPQLRAAERPRYVPRHRALIATARQDELQGWRQGRWLERRAGRVPPPPQTAAAALNAGEGTRAIAGAGNRSVPAHATGAALPDARARATAPVFAARPPAPAPAGTSGSPAKPSVARGRSSVVRASSKAPAPAPARAPAPTCASASAVARASGPAPARAPASASAPARAPRSARLLACAPGVSCTLAELPREVLHAVLRRLPARSLAACMCASRSLRAAAGEATLWDAATSAAGIALEAEARAEDAVDECASSVRAGSGGGHGAAGGVASCEQRGSARAAVATAGPAAARGRQLRSCFGAAVRARANWTHGRYASRALAGAHTWAVEALRFTRARGCGTRHRDGERLLVSGAWDGQVAAWRVRDGARAARFRGHGDWVTTLDTDGALIVSGATDGTLRAWGWDSPEPLAHFYVGSAVTCVCLLEGLAVLTQEARAGDGSTIPNGGTLSCSAWPHVIACSASDGSVHVFGVDGARRRSVRLTEPLTRAHPQTAWFVKPVLGGVSFVTAGRCGKVALWALGAPPDKVDDDDALLHLDVVSRRETHDDAVLCVATHALGDGHVANGTQKCKQVRQRRSGAMEVVASGSADGTAAVQLVVVSGDERSGAPFSRTTPRLELAVRCAVGTPVTAIALGRWPRSAGVVDGTECAEERRSSKPLAGIVLVTGDAGGRVLAWCAASGTQMRSICRHTSPVTSVFLHRGLLATLAPGDGVLVHACFDARDAREAAAAAEACDTHADSDMTASDAVSSTALLSLMDGGSFGWGANGDLCEAALALGTKDGAVHILNFEDGAPQVAPQSAWDVL